MTAEFGMPLPAYDTSLYDTGEVLHMLRVEPVAPGTFRGLADSGRRRLFGGQLVGQALAAAMQTTAVRRPHSLHATFINPGAPAAVDFAVEVLREGGAFSTRRVVATQRGQGIFQMTASFHAHEDGLLHDEPMPVADDPATLSACASMWRAQAEHAGTPYSRMPVGFFTAGWDPYEAPASLAQRHIWMRAPCRLPDEPSLHEALFAYASDYCLLFSALQPHGVGRSDPRLQRASLDHTIWFHRPFRVDEWLLLAMSSPSAAGGRGLNLSAVYDRAGRRVATVAQEALIRLR